MCWFRDRVLRRNEAASVSHGLLVGSRSTRLREALSLSDVDVALNVNLNATVDVDVDDPFPLAAAHVVPTTTSRSTVGFRLTFRSTST